MPRSISFSRTPQKVQDQSYKVTYLAVGTSTPGEVFVMRRRPIDPTRPSGATQDLYDHVATPAEIASLTINAPAAGETTFRVATWSKTYDNRDDANSEWALLRADVNALVGALNASDQSLATETVVLTG